MKHPQPFHWRHIYKQTIDMRTQWTTGNVVKHPQLQTDSDSLRWSGKWSSDTVTAALILHQKRKCHQNTDDLLANTYGNVHVFLCLNVFRPGKYKSDLSRKWKNCLTFILVDLIYSWRIIGGLNPSTLDLSPATPKMTTALWHTVNLLSLSGTRHMLHIQEPDQHRI